MDLKIGSTYHVFYEGDKDTEAYDGPAKLLEMDVDESENGDSLHYFELVDGNGGKAYFSESDVIKEIKKLMELS